MTSERCPECGQEIMATTIRGPLSILLSPCSHEIANESQLLEDSKHDPLVPGEWLVRLLAIADD